jgi:glyceraldehyde-3-phosphate dehydrogenase/erythrose-4-phosphate dehydrogenase
LKTKIAINGFGRIGRGAFSNRTIDTGRRMGELREGSPRLNVAS